MYFEPLGTEPYVPKYLRSTNSKIRNLDMAKGAIEKMVKDIWKEKSVSDSISKKREQMDNYLYTYLQKKTQGQGHNGVVELAYNFVHGCIKYDDDADLELFYKVSIWKCVLLCGEYSLMGFL